MVKEIYGNDVDGIALMVMDDKDPIRVDLIIRQ